MSYAAVYPLGTKEYVRGFLTSDRDLVAQPVEMKVNGSWVAAVYTGASVPGVDPVSGVSIWTRPIRTSLVVDFAAATPNRGQHVYARFTDSPEVPIVDCGQILVTA